MERKALGKGISALIPERPPEEKDTSVVLLKLDQIKANPLQPRSFFDSQGMEELTQSIKEKGLIQPILVRRQGESYEIIAGERRFRAAGMLNLDKIPVIVREAEDRDALELSLIENIQRQNLNPIEEAKAYQCLAQKYELTQEKISEVLGKARVTVSNTLRLLKLPQEVQDDIKNNRISYAHGRTLLEVQDENKQRQLAREVITNKLSVRELENLIKGMRPKKEKTAKKAIGKEPLIAVIEEELQRALGTKTRIIKKKKRGHIVIEFYSQEDLIRIANVIRGT